MQIYLITTDSKILLEQKIAEIVKDSTNKITYAYPDNTLTDILEEASYVSLFEEEKFLIVKNATFFGKAKLTEKETSNLMQYLEHPYPCTTLIFTSYEEIDYRKNITKKLGEVGNIFNLVAPKNYDLFLDIQKKMQKYQTNPQVVRYLIDACLNNYDVILNEIDKLALYYQKGDSISLNDIKKIVASNINDNAFKFVDAVLGKDMQQTFRLLEDFMRVKLDVLQLINLLARELRLIYYYKIYEKKKYTLINIAKELKLQDWQVKKIMKEASLYHEDDVSDYLVKLSKLDVSIKSGQVDKNNAFYAFLLEFFEY